MNNQQAIEVLSDFDKQASAKADGAYQSTIGKMACDLAIVALKKQMPKKIVITSKNGKVEKGGYVYYKCPNCDYEIGSAFHYPPNEYMMERKFCEKCGQCIDWS